MRPTAKWTTLSLTLTGLAFGCSDNTATMLGAPGSRGQADEIIVIEETVPSCDDMGAGYEPVAIDGGWACRCTIAFFCSSSSLGTLDPGTPDAPSGAGVGSGPSSSTGTGAGGAGGGDSGCTAEEEVACQNDCVDDHGTNLYACAQLFVGIPIDSWLCAPGPDGECTGGFGLCAQGYTADGYPGLMDPFCWPWPADDAEIDACRKEHQDCADQWYDTYYYSDECQTFANENKQACYKACDEQCPWDYDYAQFDAPIIKGFSP